MARFPDLSFEAFVNENVDDLVRMAYLMTWDEAGAEDLVQECLLRVVARWERVRAMEMPLAYTRRVLVNLALDDRARSWRWHGELELVVDPPLDVRAEAALENVAARAELVEALGQLPRQQRTVLALRYFLDLSEAQVAAVLGCSTGAVKSAASRGLARVRELVESETHESEVCES
jgi:RNA polymerase sigma-70 factor (sigma-E family)